MIPRKRKSYSEISSLDAEKTATTIVGGDGVSSGNDFSDDDPQFAREVAFVMEFAEKDQTLLYGNEGYRYGSLSEAAGTITRVLASSLPKTKNAKIVKAYEHVEGDDLMSCLIQALVDFSSIGFSLQDKPPSFTKSSKVSKESDTPDSETSSEESDSQEFQQLLNDISLKMDMSSLVSTLLYDWFVSDSMVLYWRVPPHDAPGFWEDGIFKPDETVPDNYIPEDKYGIVGLSDITVLSPADIDWDNTLGRDVMSVKIPITLVNLVKNAFQAAYNVNQTEAETYKSLIDQGVPKRWIDAIRNDRGYVQLLKEDGDRWLVRTKGRKYHGLANPTMYSVFLDLEIRRMLKEGDASAALMMKHFIMLLKQGESIESGPMAGHTKNWLQPKDAKALLRKFSVVNKAIRAAVNHTTKIEFVFPPKEMFDGQKYAEPNSRIFSWSGVTPILVSGDGGKYASGFLSIKRLIGKIKKAREEINTLLMHFFMDESISEKMKIPEKHLVSSNFDSNVLKEPTQLLEEIKFMFEAGIGDPRTAARELERDPDTLKSSSLQSKRENEESQVWEKLVPQHQLEMQEAAVDVAKDPMADKGGRPANPGTQTGAQTKMQRPIARQTKNS